ncbi:zinc finger protein 511 [Pieris brassicae]|uniref:C2H2-type domain-containing protein n=1 Tax=Pieris brassicae TaxID=7116 RepID=A0A9P0X8A7_PIEBR|nr:zinc finger protein 511 [Pieris brassicae]XP_045517405.1 zinc finger protein 511 [Pieris brassicae]XP_045517406.1 zinc finger protein 511 [Pieris brassicae]CAH4027988.1 unnamed protein product [Pieris brassicae]
MQDLLEKLSVYGVGKRKLDDVLFVNEFPPKVLGVYDVDEEELCHEIITSTCSIPGCKYTTDSLLDFENHYNSRHRYSCCECKKILPSPHLLDLHLQETHDSFFAVSALRKPSYCCYIEECKEKFLSPDERMDHCVKIHKIPKDFRFDQKPKKNKNKSDAMDVDSEKKFMFCNNKSKSFKYSGKKFTNDTKATSSVDIDMVVSSLRENLPQ